MQHGVRWLSHTNDTDKPGEVQTGGLRFTSLPRCSVESRVGFIMPTASSAARRLAADAHVRLTLLSSLLLEAPLSIPGKFVGPAMGSHCDEPVTGLLLVKLL